MPLRPGNVTLDCDDVLRVARFWSAALGRPLDPRSSEVFASIGGKDADRAELAWYFAKADEPKQGKNRVHLDLVPDGTAEDEAERLIGLGARRADVGQTGDEPFIVLADPEDNEFCLLRRRLDPL